MLSELLRCSADSWFLAKMLSLLLTDDYRIFRVVHGVVLGVSCDGSIKLSRETTIRDRYPVSHILNVFVCRGCWGWGDGGICYVIFISCDPWWAPSNSPPPPVHVLYKKQNDYPEQNFLTWRFRASVNILHILIRQKTILAWAVMYVFMALHLLSKTLIQRIPVNR